MYSIYFHIKIYYKTHLFGPKLVFLEICYFNRNTNHKIFVENKNISRQLITYIIHTYISQHLQFKINKNEELRTIKFKN